MERLGARDRGLDDEAEARGDRREVGRGLHRVEPALHVRVAVPGPGRREGREREPGRPPPRRAVRASRAGASSSAGAWCATRHAAGCAPSPSSSMPTATGTAAVMRVGAQLAVPLGDLVLDDRDDVPPEVDGVVEQVVAARGDDPHAQVVVREQRLRDGLGRAHQGVRVARAAGRLGRRGPQRGVEPLALLRDLEQPLRARVLRCAGRTSSGPAPPRPRPCAPRCGRGRGAPSPRRAPRWAR